MYAPLPEWWPGQLAIVHIYFMLISPRKLTICFVLRSILPEAMFRSTLPCDLIERWVVCCFQGGGGLGRGSWLWCDGRNVWWDDGRNQWLCLLPTTFQGSRRSFQACCLTSYFLLGCYFCSCCRGSSSYTSHEIWWSLQFISLLPICSLIYAPCPHQEC